MRRYWESQFPKIPKAAKAQTGEAKPGGHCFRRVTTRDCWPPGWLAGFLVVDQEQREHPGPVCLSESGGWHRKKKWKEHAVGKKRF